LKIMSCKSTCLLVLETLLLMGALGTGLTATATLFLSREEISGSNCLLYGTFNWTGGAVEGDKSRCDFSLFSQIAVSAVALVSALYRCLNICCEKLDVKCFRVLALILYVLCVVCVFIESILVHVGVVNFCDSMRETRPSLPEESTCQENQELYNELNDVEANFFGLLRITTITSWVSLVIWLALTLVASISLCVGDDDDDYNA
jgi:hypothetical protein